MSFTMPTESSFKTLAKALEPLELAGKLRYLPKFECCSSCAGARLNGFMEISSEDWGDYELYVTFNEQAKERAKDQGELSLTAWGFDLKFSKEDEARINRLIADELIAGGFREVPDSSAKYPRPMFDPNFEVNTFYLNQHGSIIVRGYFTGKARPTKAVRALELKY